MQKILIMGGSYFIGKAIAERLSKDAEVTLLNRGSKPAPRSINQLVCDRNDAQQMKEVLLGHYFDYIVDVCGLNASQADILVNSLEDCSSLKMLVFISSSAVYDAENLHLPFKESDNLAANKYWTYYGTDKIAAENTYRTAFADTSVKTVFLRPPYVYGENNYAQRESFIFDHLINDRPVIIPKSNPMLQFIYARDLADIIAEIIRRCDSMSQNTVYNVGNSTSVSCCEWVETCGQAAGIVPQIIEYDYEADGRQVRDFFPFFDYDNVLDVSAVKAIYPHETPFVEGLRNSFEWFRQNRDNIQFKPNVAHNEIDILNNMQK